LRKSKKLLLFSSEEFYSYAMELYFEKAIGLLKRIPTSLRIPIILSSLGLMLFGWGLIQIFGSQATHETVSLNGFSQSQNATSSGQVAGAKTISQSVAIDIEGAVSSPGVYKLPQGAIMQDALIAAGGLSSAADRTAVAQRINLAAKVSDGSKLYIPAIGEASHPSGTSGEVASQGVSSNATSQLNINTASLSDLVGLKGVGKVTAQKIIDGRPYTSVDELQSRKVVSASIFGKIKDLVVCY